MQATRRAAAAVGRAHHPARRAVQARHRALPGRRERELPAAPGQRDAPARHGARAAGAVHGAGADSRRTARCACAPPARPTCAAGSSTRSTAWSSRAARTAPTGTARSPSPSPRASTRWWWRARRRRRGRPRCRWRCRPAEAKGPLTDGAKLSLGASVVTLTVPVAEKDAVQEIGFTSQDAVLLRARGPAAARWCTAGARSTDCSLLVRPRTDVFKVRLWTTDGSAQVVAVAAHQAGGRGRRGRGAVGPGALHRGAARGPLPHHRAGLVPARRASSGLLRALRPGGLAGGRRHGVRDLRRRARCRSRWTRCARLASDAPQPLELAARPSLQVVTAPAPSVFLLSASVRHGERAAPACLFDGDGTVHEGRDTACFAASRVGTEAGARLWAASDAGGRVARHPPRGGAALEGRGARRRGAAALSFPGGVGLYALPGGSARAPRAHAARRTAGRCSSTSRAARWTCARPPAALSQCVLTGQGGKVLLGGAARRRPR